VNIKRWPITKIVLGCTTAFLGAYYCRALNLGPLELARFVTSAVALWMPVGAWLYLLLRSEVSDRVVRLAFSAGASYALTTLFYFAAATLHLNWLFYLVEATAGGGLVYYAIKHRLAFKRLLKHFSRFDWVLAALIAASMVTNIPVQSVWRRDVQTGAMIYDGYPDHLYHVGQSYELSRHIPPRQATIRGGTPERAYHNFMHVTTMLVGRYTGQPDMLRAYLIYHYGVIQILMCLLLYGIGKTLTDSRIAGYCTLALMYVAVAPAPNLWPVASLVKGLKGLSPDSPFPSYYFTVFPHLSSGLDIVTLVSPQMYAGIVVLYAGLLGLLIVLERAYRGHDAPIVVFVTAFVLAATTRFRVHIALAVIPGFLLVLLYLWRRKHQKVFLLAGLSAVFVAGLLYLEMRSPVYLQGSSNIRLGYTGLSVSQLGGLFRSWPLAAQVHDWLTRAIPQEEIMKWSWEATCLLMFTLLNVIGIPLLAATSVYLTSDRARRVFAPFNFLVLWAVLTSISLAIILQSDYDNYSVGGQLPFHTRWYLFPFAGVALWSVSQFIQRRVSWPPAVWICLASIVLVAGLLYRIAGPASAVRRFDRENSVAIKAEDWPAFVFVREHAPPDSVVLANGNWGFYQFVVSGLAGRADYFEFSGNPVHEQALRLNPRDDRVSITNALLSTTSDEQFCRLLRSTPITHILEFQDHPLAVHPADCLTRLWENPEHTVIIWQVTRGVHL
jgi:hypothetical protein